MTEEKAKSIDQATIEMIEKAAQDEARTVFERAEPGAGADGGREVLPGIMARNRSFRRTDPLAEEIDAFLEAVAAGTPPRVDGLAGRRALAAALAVAKKISRR